MSDLKLLSRTIQLFKKEEGTVLYWRCPLCKKAYLIGLNDEKAKKLINEQHDLLKEIDLRRDKGLPVPSQKLIKQEELKKEIRLHQEYLKIKYKKLLNLVSQW